MKKISSLIYGTVSWYLNPVFFVYLFAKYKSIVLIPNMLDKTFQQMTLWNIFLIFPRKSLWHFMRIVPSEKIGRHFMQIVSSAYFLEKRRKNIITLSSFELAQNITKTYLYNFDPLKPHFYIVKLGFTGVYISFLSLLKNIDCGYSLELLPNKVYVARYEIIIIIIISDCLSLYVTLSVSSISTSKTESKMDSCCR